MIPQLVVPASTALEVCAFAEKWGIHPDLAWRLHHLAELLPFSIRIISGYRSPEHQQDLLDAADSTAAPVGVSTHTSCPATGADLDPDVPETVAVKRAIGEAAESVGLRWGGGARRQDGVPVDPEWRHVDLGPRR